MQQTGCVVSADVTAACCMQSRSNTAGEQASKDGSYFGSKVDKMDDLPPLPQADKPGGLPGSCITFWTHACVAIKFEPALTLLAETIAYLPLSVLLQGATHELLFAADAAAAAAAAAAEMNNCLPCMGAGSAPISHQQAVAPAWPS